jgi:NhaA family Na+:H+ antiporter
MANIRMNLTVFKKFFRSGSFGGILLLLCVIISIAIANSSYGEAFEKLLDKKLGFSLPHLHLRFSIATWINDGLMAIFFLLVGLEIKRELLEGELASPKRAFLPVAAAFGGAFLPALIYVVINWSSKATIAGWGIPMATDIAFAIGILSLIGNKVPSSLRIFLTALAIVDDLIAILVIAIFYSGNIHFTFLLLAGFTFLVMAVLNRLRCKNLAAYLILGVVLWYFLHNSGIHATIAGVLTALTIPTNKEQVLSPLERLEHFLSNPVHYIIMPVFALANTNIRLEKSILNTVDNNLSLGIIIGLIVGKTVGITLSSWAVVKLGLGKLPRHATWPQMIGLGMLGGIGFTMSIFIALLSFPDIQLQTEAKFSILIASVLSGSIGCIYLMILDGKKNRTQLNN